MCAHQGRVGKQNAVCLYDWILVSQKKILYYYMAETWKNYIVWKKTDRGHLLHKHDYLSSTSIMHIKILVIMLLACNHNTWEAKAGIPSDQQIPGSVRDPVSEEVVNVPGDDTRGCPQVFTWQVHAVVCTHTGTQSDTNTLKRKQAQKGTYCIIPFSLNSYK